MKKKIAFYYQDLHQKHLFRYIANHLNKKKFNIFFTNNLNLKCDFGFYAENSNNINAVNNTSNYSDNFRYAKYSISNEIINVPSKIGICGDKNFIEHQNDAKKILYDNAKYFSNGSWTEGFESKSDKITNAINDTGDGIRNNLTSEKQYAKKMDNIDEQYDDLQEQIPKFNHLKHIMTENPKYDFKGDELLHFRTHDQPDIRQKKIIDNNELYVNSELLFTLGTVTTAILIVFAIMLARD